MGSINIHDGSWKQANNFHVNTGSWRQAKKVYVHNGAGWVLAWQNEITEYFNYADGATYYGTGTDPAGYRGTAKLTTARGNAVLVQGSNPNTTTSYVNHRGHWIMGNGSVSGTPIYTALSGRTIASFKVNLDLSWTYWGRYNTDGTPTRYSVFGTSYSTIPGTFLPSSMIYLGSVAFFPSAQDYDYGYYTVTAAQLGKDPRTQGNRYPSYRGNIDLTSQLSSNAKTQLTNGYIKGFCLMAVDKWNGARYNDKYWYGAANKPGVYYKTDGQHAATGTSIGFRVTVTHTG